MEEFKLTRKELYDLVWSTPMTAIAKKFLISDVGLRKICIGMDIPLPRAGHWEKVKAGKPLEIALLPPKFSGKDEITLRLRTENDPPPAQKDPVRLIAKELIIQNIEFKVADTMITKDPRILKAQKALTEKKQYLDKGLAWSGRGNLSINVSPHNVERALCFMQALIRVLEERGHQLQVNAEETVVIISGQSITIALREKVKITRVPTNWGSYNNEYVPEGSLILKLGNYGAKEWKDGTKKLEEQLPEIIARMEFQAQEMIKAEIVRRKREEEHKEKEKQRIALEQRKKTELTNFRKLITDAERWQLTQRLRHYLLEFEKHAVDQNKLTDDLRKWLIWAQQKVDWYDPFINAQDEWLTEEDIRKVFIQEKATNYPFFTDSTETSSYFPRPWYAR